jgi:hypothetical protein
MEDLSGQLRPRLVNESMASGGTAPQDMAAAAMTAPGSPPGVPGPGLPPVASDTWTRLGP